MSNLIMKQSTIKSTELVGIINEFRKAEGNETEIRHDSFMEKIKKEIKTLKSLNINSLQNFSESTYINSRGKEYPCFELNRDGMLQMLNTESVYVRYKTIEYINKLEEKINLPSTYSEALRQLADKVEENEKQKVIIQEQKPKVLFAESVQASTTTILIGQLAKILKQNGIDMGQNRLFEWLRKNGYLIGRKGTDYNMPTQKSMDLGLFTIKETSIGHSDGHVSISSTPKVTGKGQVYFVNKFKEMQEGAKERQATK